MTGPTDPFAARLDFARGAALAAGERTLSRFRSTSLRAETKRDGTPVTEADRDAEQFLRAEVARSFPSDAFLGEEFGETPGTSGFRWVVDPIDGTKSFLCGVPLYGTMVAVETLAAGVWKPVIGVIRMPALDETVWAAQGRGAFTSIRGGAATPARVSGVRALGESVILTTGLEYIRDGGALEQWGRLSAACKLVRGWSDCYGCVLLATGRAELWFEPLMKRWDVAAAIPIITEAGGRCTDWSGKTDAGSSECLGSNGLVHDEALAVIAGRRKIDAC